MSNRNVGLTDNFLPLASLEPASDGAVRRSLGLGLGRDRIPEASQDFTLFIRQVDTCTRKRIRTKQRAVRWCKRKVNRLDTWENVGTGFERGKLHLCRIQEIHAILIECNIELLDALILLQVH